MGIWRTLFALLGLCLLVACGGGESTVETPLETADVPLEVTRPRPLKAVPSGVTVRGTVRYDGTPPSARTFVPNKDTEVCGTAERVAGDLLVDADLGIGNVVVSLVDAPAVDMDVTVKAMVDQKGCLFNPRVVQVAVGAPMVFLNNDNIFHNIHTKGTVNTPLNKAQPGFMKRVTESFANPEIFEVACDVHSWMKGWIVVQEHPYYAVTSTDGTYALTDVSDGTYTVRFWHETLGERTTQVVVSGDGPVAAEISFSQ